MTYRRVLRSQALPAREDALSDEASRLATTASATTVSDPTIRKARVGRSRVLLTRLPSGDVVAFQPRCPHEGTSLADATLFEGRVRCPRHNYLYDPSTGENILPARETRPEKLWRLKPGYLQTYPVQEQEGWIWVSDVPNPPPTAYDPDLEAGPPPDPATDAAATAAPRTEAEPEEPAAGPPATVTATAGTEFELALPTRPLPAHIWHVEVSGTAVAVLDETMESADGSTVRVRLAAREPGEATVRCAYAQPWAEQARQVHTVTVSVEA